MGTNTVKIEIEIALYKRREYWIAYAPALKVYGFSSVDKDSALKDFDDAIETFVRVHSKLNTLSEVLLNLGWSRKDHTYDQPLYFNLPIEELRGISATKSNRSISLPVN